MRTLFILPLLTVLLAGCAMTDWISGDEQAQITKVQPHSTNSLHRHVEKIARQLLNTSQFIDTSHTLAVGTILPATPPRGGSLPQHSSMALQIQESLMTFATQAGLKVVEYKAMPTIKIGEQADSMLSRKLDELNPSISADYFLTGTYTLQENSTMVNVRLIQIPENIVLAAATDYVPNDAMWSDSQVTLKHNKLYRSAN